MSTMICDGRDSVAVDKPCSGISMIITPREKDLGDMMVRRVLPYAKQRMVGPWLFFDHMGPATFAPGEGLDVRPHPHINLATVTYLFDGEILHRDSLGSEQYIRPGDINLMVAGRGIVHSERTGAETRARGHLLHGLQLWFALPQVDEETAPDFLHYPSAAIPAVEVAGVPVRVMMGTAYGVTAPVKTFSPMLYLEAHLPAGAVLTLPDTVTERALYVAAGRVVIRDTGIEQYSMAVLEPGAPVTITAAETSRIALIGGEPVGPRHIWWNFASSRLERIEAAKADWKAGRFPKVPGDDKEFIPLPE